ncbi:4-hydroxythreonine-4-phosphate dehydrogenase [Ketogulonicigenium robustum]|uniref:4-hydroxythreonine-4-phosphate dehydrogenase n=1 Tax=Ketogulonicigenium robustum TaxID=92947 RepID=A0A1W6NZP5_9RHOB|nr:4-hydroxythreonine-4-phosphate dehydrogenase PdxA [Ketogulonicigenium robustum]ARO14742.1 4-hydroxythreonine-4-phosphate dehydrogenase [Ketogulonicigenium robustum]
MTIAITCGEPAGIGPEIAVKAFSALRGELPVLWIGDPRHLPNGTDFVVVDDPTGPIPTDRFPVLAQNYGPAPRPGVADPALAHGVIAAIETGSQLALRGVIDGICTAPIHKAALVKGAGFPYPGHTEFLAALGGVDQVVMMLACDALRVVPVTIHIAITDVPRRLTPELLAQTLRITHAGLQRDFGLAEPRIAVAGLNPHAGEEGLMGHEEIDMIRPVLDELRGEGLNLIGPLPADTMFHAGARRGYDVAVCMYHDQALIPIKTLDFAGGVNVTLGLPFIRTSPDHGTAFDIAGKGMADPSSMIAALRMAAQMAAARKV